MAGRIVAIVGSRAVGKKDQQQIEEIVQQVIGSLDANDILLSGGCSSGADKAVRKDCEYTGMPYIEAPAFWSRGKHAGCARNKTIARVCSHMVAVWDGKSPGTKIAIDSAMKIGRPVWIIELTHEYDETPSAGSSG